VLRQGREQEAVVRTRIASTASGACREDAAREVVLLTEIWWADLDDGDEYLFFWGGGRLFRMCLYVTICKQFIRLYFFFLSHHRCSTEKGGTTVPLYFCFLSRPPVGTVTNFPQE